MGKRIIIVSVLMVGTLSLIGQVMESPFKTTEATLREQFKALYKSENDKTSDSLNLLISTQFSASLESPESIGFKWDSLNMIGSVHSPDQKLNVYTWFIQRTKGGYSYFGYVQYNIGSKKHPEIRVYTLSDKSKGMKNPETLNLTPENWLGCVYYNAYQFSYHRNTYYTLLGYNFNNDFSDKKYIEQLSFDKEGNANFGGDFQLELQKVKRVILEYSAQVVASIKYDDKLQMIVFDHLAPFESMFTGNYRFYGPDGSYDGFKFRKGSFLLQKDVDARNGQ
jgi:hypothetical protein